MSYLTDNGYYIPFNNTTKLILKELFEDEEIEMIGFDLKCAIKIFLLNNIKMKGILFDVQIAHYLLQPDTRHALDIIFNNYFWSNCSIYRISTSKSFYKISIFIFFITTRICY